MDEQVARRIVLAQAIETADAAGKLVSAPERDVVDRQAREAAEASGAEPGDARVVRFLDLRAQLLLRTVQQRHPAVAALQHRGTTDTWLGFGLPLAAFAIGALTDLIADPHKVDLLSLPLLGVVAWNLAVYLAIFLAWILARDHPPRLPAALGRWSEVLRHGVLRSGRLRADVTALFHLRWNQATAALQQQHWKVTLHLAALAWALGIAFSLVVRGAVVQYQVGWESTWFSAAQVHAILGLLLKPVVLLFRLEPFSLQEIAALQLSPGTGNGAHRRWVWMYVALLLLVVVLPRAVLALYASWRKRLLAREVQLDLQDRYFQRLVSLLNPARVQLCVIAHRSADREALLRVLLPDHGQPPVVMGSAHGDSLRLVDLPAGQAPPRQLPYGSEKPRWGNRALEALWPRAGRPVAAADSQLQSVRDDCDVVLHVVAEPDQIESASALRDWLGKPALVLVVPRDDESELARESLLARCHQAAGRSAMVAELLSFDAFARCWVQDRVLLDAIGRCLPQAKEPGFQRIVQAWDARNHERFARSMAALAHQLLFSASQVEEVPSGALSVKSLVSPSQRQAQAQARQTAMAAVVQRLDRSAQDYYATLRSLHAIDAAAGVELEHRLDEKFIVQQTVDSPQAGMAGAASGAVMGASVDLMVGGLTLGAAAAIGALVGGSAAFVAAAWKNRATAHGTTAVQLSDDMMQAIAEAGLLRYLAAAHHGRNASGAAGELSRSWKSEVVAAVEAHRERLVPFWNAARLHPDSHENEAALAGELETVTRKLLSWLYAGLPAGSAGSADRRAW